MDRALFLGSVTGQFDPLYCFHRSSQYRNLEIGREYHHDVTGAAFVVLYRRVAGSWRYLGTVARD
jgi:hypothetical protein